MNSAQHLPTEKNLRQTENGLCPIRIRIKRRFAKVTHPTFCQLQEYLEREGVPVMNDGDFKIDTVNDNPLSATLLRNTLHKSNMSKEQFRISLLVR